MSVPKFKVQASEFRRELKRPVISLQNLEQILGFLRSSKQYSDDPDYQDLCASFGGRLRTYVNPYRHRTILETFRDPSDLNEAKLWLQLWVDTLATLDCVARHLAEWHRTYDVALYRVLSAILRQRRDQAELATEGWVEAATICREWLNKNHALRDTEEYKMLDADYHFFEGRSERAWAQGLLDRRPRTPEAFDEIASVFQKGLTSMKRAERKPGHPEVVQLEYYKELCILRGNIMRRDFPKCASCLDKLTQIAPNTKMKHLPYFGQIEQIAAETAFLEAFRALVDGDVPMARRAAEPLRLTDDLREGATIRGKLLGLRQLAMEILDGSLARVDELESVWGGGVGLGQASRFIVETCRGLARKQLSTNEAREKLISVFPLDAFPPVRESDSVDVTETLPRIYKGSLTEDPRDTQYVRSELLFLEWQYVANIAEYLCGLYRLKRDRREILGDAVALLTDFRLLSFKELAELLRYLQKAIGWDKDDLQVLIEWIDGLHEEGADGEWDTVVHRGRFRECMKNTAQFLFPHVVSVMDQRLLEDGKVEVQLAREWVLPQQSMVLGCIGAKGLEIGKCYFLKAPFKWKFGPRYDEDLLAAITFHPASTFPVSLTLPRCSVLVEGKHDVYAFTKILDGFVPYWKARVDLRRGDGDSLPREWRRLRELGDDRIIVVADGDKRGRWDRMSPFWVDPDFEGVDPSALSEAVAKLWGDSIGVVTPERIADILASPDLHGSTVEKLVKYSRDRVRSFSLPDENEIKARLRVGLSEVWVRRRQLPTQLRRPLLQALEIGFGLKEP